MTLFVEESIPLRYIHHTGPFEK